MIANLPMYERAELAQAHNQFWQLIRKNLNIESPEHLSQDAGEMEVWIRPDLILSQACGKPYREILHNKVTLIGTPDYDIEGCPPGYYRSAFVIRKEEKREQLDDFKDALFAYNNKMSQSGYHVANDFFESEICSGGHLNSAKMVAQGKADIAAIDAISLVFMEKYEVFFTKIKILSWTEPTPGLPYITALGNDKEEYFDAIKNAISELPEDVRRTLKIKDIVDITKEDYFI
ncbi:MAG: PhnD/SsuA/transferrin family substrate-binding protein [Kordiimonadaceae bacterium]|nr:PhnD/SsuA/transferrin family substrate-binding protein [Kordiimonadaceae bacterium]